MQSSPPTSDGKARAIRELSRSLSHSPRNITSPSPPRSDSNPTQIGLDTHSDSDFFNDPDVLMSTQQNVAEFTDTLPQYRGIRSTAKKMNRWAGFQPEQVQPDTSMVNKEFGDFDHSISDEESMSIEQARGNRSNRSTPNKVSSQFDSLYNMTPPTNRSRKSLPADTGSLRRDAAIRRASRNDFDAASPRPASKRNSPAMHGKGDRSRTSLSQLHAKLSEDESSFMDQRPPTLTMDSTKNTRWGNRSRQTSLQTDGHVDAPSYAKATPRSRPATAQNATAQSFILPDLPNLTELVSGVFGDGTPVFSRTSKSRFAQPPYGGRRPSHIPIKDVPTPDEEKAIYSALQQLQEKVAQMEQERAEQEKKIEEQDLELIELRATAQAHEKLRRSDSAQDSDATAKSGWKVEKTRTDATLQTLRTKLDRADRKSAVLEIEKKRLSTERDNLAAQLRIAFQTCEEVKSERTALSNENEELRDEIETLRAENESLREQLEQDQSQHRQEIRVQQDENTQQLTRKDFELQQARQDQAQYARLKSEHDLLRAQIAELKAKREVDVKRWSKKEATLRAQVDRRDDTIQGFRERYQNKASEAMLQDNENLRNELQELQAQLDADSQEWAEKEAELQRKIRKGDVRKARDVNDRNFDDTTAPTTRSTVTERVFEEPLQRRPSYRREDTRTRTRNPVQQEVRNSRAANASNQESRVEESPRKSYTGHSRFSQRSVSAPIKADKHATAETEVESTTDLSLAPRSTIRISRNPSRQTTTNIQPPEDLDITELSYIKKDDIARLRRSLEEERAARLRATSAQADEPIRDDTIRSQRQAREDTVRSVASAKSERRPSLVRKSSLKDTTQRTNATQFEEDTGNMSNLDADTEATQTKQSGIDASSMSNTGRRRRSAPTEMTSAFIVPDIKLNSAKSPTTATSCKPISKDHDNVNCTVCRREGYTTSTEPLRVPKLVRVSVRTADDVDATLRPAQSPKEALALVVKELKDERVHLHTELAVHRAMLEHHDPSLGDRRRRELNAAIQDMLRRIELLDRQIYRLYDVLEGQQVDDMTEQDIEDITEQIRAEEQEEVEAKTQQQQPEKKAAKKVTIRSFVDEDDHSVEVVRRTSTSQQDKNHGLV
ncbi:AAR2 domain containing protein [Pyrenophora tritici-repentis]|nr:AAR2 domain containing protein [Pyrenophora tritici-repentis]